MQTDDAKPSIPGQPTAVPGRGHWHIRLRESLAQALMLLQFRIRSALVLARRALASLNSRGATATLRKIRERVFPPRRQPGQLQLYPSSTSAHGLQFPVECAQASIVIPVHGQLALTLRCLHALAASGDGTAFEVIVVDDASTDDSSAVLPAIPGLRYLRNPSNLGFIDSCNAGAALSGAEFIVFLNNDTLVQPGWLDALLKTFVDFPDTGLAGAKLVYPDGRLQEAGGIVFSDGSAANYGRNGDPADPRYEFVREADYCSGAAIALPRMLFAKLGGFDTHFRPAYFEDTDLALRVRQHGLRVRYQPASVVVHLEGATAGTDVRHGIKAYQVANEQKFRARWTPELAGGYPSRRCLDAGGNALSRAANHRAVRQLLIIDSATPTPDRDSGSVRMLELMRLLLQDGCAVTFFNQTALHDGQYTRTLQQLGVETWARPWLTDPAAWLRKHGPRFDAVIVSRHYVLSPLLPLLRRYAPQAFVVFDTVDLHFLREQRAAAGADAGALRAAARTRAAELALLRSADATWVVSGEERDLLLSLEPQARIEVVSNIHHARSLSPGFDQRTDLIFFGSYRHPPNVDAAIWLSTEIFPLVRTQLPDLHLHLVGADAPAQVLGLANNAGVVVHGHVPDLDALLDRVRVSVAPLRYGAGIKGKVNHSLARGLPVVATSCATEAMFLSDGHDVLVANDAEAIAAAIVRLYTDEVLWRQLSEAGITNTQRHFSPEVAQRTLHDWLVSLPTFASPAHDAAGLAPT